MTKDEAIIALQEGKILTHRHFTNLEFVFEKDGVYQFEDLVKCEPKEFWAYRTDISWDIDWEIYNK